MLSFNRVTYLSLLFKLLLSERLGKFREDQMFYYSQDS